MEMEMHQCNGVICHTTTSKGAHGSKHVTALDSFNTRCGMDI